MLYAVQINLFFSLHIQYGNLIWEAYHSPTNAVTFQTQIHKHIVVLKTLLHKNIQLRYFPYYFSFVLLHWIFQREKLPNENNISSNHLSLTAYVKRTSFGVSKQFHRNQFSWRPNSTVGHILQKLTRVLITQMAHTFPHQKTELSQMRKRMTPRESQTNTFPTQSSMIDSCQNQLAKMPKQHFMLKSLPSSNRCTYLVLELFGLSRYIFSSTKEKHKLGASTEQGRKREHPRNKWFHQLLGTSLQSPSWGQPATRSRLIAAFLVLAMAGVSTRENPGELNPARTQQLTLDAKNHS